MTTLGCFQFLSAVYFVVGAMACNQGLWKLRYRMTHTDAPAFGLLQQSKSWQMGGAG